MINYRDTSDDNLNNWRPLYFVLVVNDDNYMMMMLSQTCTYLVIDDIINIMLNDYMMILDSKDWANVMMVNRSMRCIMDTPAGEYSSVLYSHPQFILLLFSMVWYGNTIQGYNDT